MEFTINTLGSTTFQSLLVTREDKADEFAIKMITNNEIDGLLPLSVIRKNNDMEVRYNITSMIPLHQFMQSPLPRVKILKIIKSIVAATIELEEYMLDGQALVFQEEYMYVDIADGTTRLMYLPVQNPYQSDVVTFVKKIMTEFQFQQNEDASYILKFMNAFNSGRITTPGDLLEFVEELENTKPAAKAPAQAEPKKVSAEPVRVTPAPQQNTPAAQAVSPQPVPSPQINIPKPVADFASLAGKDKDKEKDKQGLLNNLFGKNPKEKEPAKEKAKEKEKEKGHLFGKKPNKPAPASAITPGFAVPGMNDVSGLPLNQAEVASAQQARKEISQPKQPVVQTDNSRVAVAASQQETYNTASMPAQLQKRDYGNTIMLNQNNSNVTIVLGEDGMDDDEPKRAALTRLLNRQKMYIDKDVFHIGKDSDYADFYIGDNPAVSRAHADIVRQGDTYYIQDNNSKNHTYIAGQMVMPGQMMPLTNDTKIKIANEEFLFTLS